MEPDIEYVCPLCKTTYKRRKGMENCMAKHKRVVSTEEEYWFDGERYPKTLKVYFNDGKTVEYIRRSAFE